MLFENRRVAGVRLAEELFEIMGRDAAVLALPRWGVPVAFEVAKALHFPLDTLVVRKLGISSNPEFAFWAISQAGILVIDTSTVSMFGLTQPEIDGIIRRERAELERREKTYDSGGFLEWKTFDTIIIVDDGMATGANMEAAVHAAKALYHPNEIVVAVPVASTEAVDRILQHADECLVLLQSDTLGSISQYYVAFPQIEDDEVIAILQASHQSQVC